MVDYVELCEKFKIFFTNNIEINWKKHVPVTNDAFPGNFNISFNELEHLKEFRNYLTYTKPLLFGKIQPAIRYNDFIEKILPNKNSYKYLGLFDMGEFPYLTQKEKILKEKLREL